MAKIQAIRPDVEIIAHVNEIQSYIQETRECQRYDLRLCRVCDRRRLDQSPWCNLHFPWKGQVPTKLRETVE